MQYHWKQELNLNIRSTHNYESTYAVRLANRFKYLLYDNTYLVEVFLSNLLTRPEISLISLKEADIQVGLYYLSRAVQTLHDP